MPDLRNLLMFNRKKRRIEKLEEALFNAGEERYVLIQGMNLGFSQTLVPLIQRLNRYKLAYKSARKRANAYKHAHRITAYVLQKERDNRK